MSKMILFKINNNLINNNKTYQKKSERIVGTILVIYYVYIDAQSLILKRLIVQHHKTYL